jgi:hypothetical protein
MARPTPELDRAWAKEHGLQLDEDGLPAMCDACIAAGATCAHSYGSLYCSGPDQGPA